MKSADNLFDKHRQAILTTSQTEPSARFIRHCGLSNIVPRNRGRTRGRLGTFCQVVNTRVVSRSWLKFEGGVISG